MLPKIPAACADLDLAQVSRVLAKHLGDIPRAAKELDVSGPDLNRLTWARPKLLEEAELERMGVIARAQGVVIEALNSDDPRRRMWGAERLMSSWLARNSPFAPARRGRAASAGSGETRTIAFRWADGEGKLSEALEPGVVVEPPVAPTFEPPRPPKALPADLPRWPGPHPPPPLVEGKFSWEPPRPAPREPEPEPERSMPRPRLSRGGYR